VSTKVNKKIRAYETLKKQIISMELAPGTPINEAELAASLGVSKTPLREALTQLEGDGFVDTVPARGSSISHITAREVSDVFQIREIIETGVAKRVSAIGGTPDILKERDSVAGMLNDASGRYVFEWGAVEDMHLSLVRALGNDLLVNTYERLMERISRIRNFYGDRFSRRRLEDIASEHARILDAVVCGDSRAAEQYLAEHLRNARSFLTGLREEKTGVQA